MLFQLYCVLCWQCSAFVAFLGFRVTTDSWISRHHVDCRNDDAILIPLAKKILSAKHAPHTDRMIQSMRSRNKSVCGPILKKRMAAWINMYGAIDTVSRYWQYYYAIYEALLTQTESVGNIFSLRWVHLSLCGLGFSRLSC